MSSAPQVGSETSSTTARRGGRFVAAGLLCALVLAIDLLTKDWAWETLRRGRPIRVIRGFFHFEFAFNTGAAFGVLGEATWARWVFVAITLGAIAWVTTIAWRWRGRYAGLLASSTGLIVGGALGNLHDRLFRGMAMFGGTVRHGVVDFIVLFYWPKRRWPAFNVADIAVLLGMAGLLFVLWRARKPPEAS
jgi:signal peptidase II